MGLLSEKMLEAMRTGKYPCEQCGNLMVWENDREDILVCPNCGYSVDSDHYGFTDEEYEALYPTLEELIDQEENEEADEESDGEIYEEVYDELDD